jgi:hypothetical protein
VKQVGIFDMDVNLLIKNITGGILIFIVRDRISVKKILNVSMITKLDSKIIDEIP